MPSSVRSGRAVPARIIRFAAIGAASTIAYALLFLALAPALGSADASAAALAVTAVANTAANRRMTFLVRGREGLARQHLAALAVFVLALGVTNGALSALHSLDPRAPHTLEVVVLVAATLVATAIRYLALARWVFADPSRGVDRSRRAIPSPPLPIRGASQP